MQIISLFLCITVALNASARAQMALNSLYEPQVFQGMQFRVMKPLTLDEKSRYPVIVSLHGAGGRGEDNHKQLKDWTRQLAEPKRRKAFPCYVVAPQVNELWNADHLLKIKSLIDTLSSVDTNRLYVMGHSMGGHGTYIFLQLDPDYFAAAAPSAGSGRSTTKDFIDAAKIKDIPIWAFHGDKDRVCPYEKERDVFLAVGKREGNMKLTTWIGDNHGVSGKMIPGAENGKTENSGKRCDLEPDFMTWLFSQSRQRNEIDCQVHEVEGLISRLNKTPGKRNLQHGAEYLRKTVLDLRELRRVRGELLVIPAKDTKQTQALLQKKAAELTQQIEADEELITMIAQGLEAPEDEDLEIEIDELRSELKGFRARSTGPETTSGFSTRSSTDRPLKSGQYDVVQSWSQEDQFRRPFFVNVPKPKLGNPKRFPVFIFLHGNGGNARQAMQSWLRNRKDITSRYIMVFAQGYRESWNIVSERSRANDLQFIESIVRQLLPYVNVSPNDFTIMGASNGAALVNQLAIESRLPNVRNYISSVSPLNVWQYSGKRFKAKGEDNNYRLAVTPVTGKRLMNISGTKDKLVPYEGGPSKVIPAKGGKLAFLNAELSTFLWAKAMGYDGAQLSEPTRTIGSIELYSYLDGDIIHCKMNGSGHAATHEISEQLLLSFLQGRKVETNEK